MKKMFKATAAAAMIGLLAFAAAGCGGDKKAEHKEVVKFGVTNFADSLETTDMPVGNGSAQAPFSIRPT